ncbi:arginine--tRNA ligase [[Eubacterium] siraeum DSM 15702]|uniref:Arginine--tRNA ligase n=1 Tax=[Eubacterium] siraeum DSM 15702 TaxID=428128 RepID=B0MM62_9FIRM|nr:arginine--tRNA ligase [[Eubacterium] siraeum DSM 15702]UWP24488.1 arginine--tRNA ligase [[Eubacterium] siraeum]
MNNMIELAKQQVKETIMNALGRLVAEGKIEAVPLPAFNVERPADVSHGDFSCNAAMASAKALRNNPRAIGQMIADAAVLDGTVFEKIEVAGPGFLNFFISPLWFNETVGEVISSGSDYGKTELGKGKRVLVEFVSANPTGPMHIGNARGGALGDSLSSVLQFAGYEVEREFYVNDAGNQIEKFGKSLSIRYMQIADGNKSDVIASYGDDDVCRKIFEDEENFPMPEDVYKGVDIIEHAYNFYKINGDKFVNADEESRKSALVEYALPLNIDGLEKDLAKYRIVYDTWFRESSLHKSGAVKQIVDMLTDKGQTYEKDGAIWFKASDFGDDQDRVLVRANGIPTYFVPDIAYHYNKLVTRGFDKAIDILGADHHGYIARMKAALTALGVDASKLDIVIMQMVMLVRNGETVKLSKRSGKAITLSTLLDEVPIDAARFFFNLRDPNTHLEFDLELAIEESSNNPVFYVQYAHARICSILRRMEEEGTGYSNIPVSELNFNHPAELALIRHIAALPNCINEAAKDYNPSKITKYLCDLAQLFHKFYDNCKIKGEEENILQSRLSLCVATKTVFKNLLDLLKVDAPEKM